ncbi:hypothetical protein ACFLRQ_00575 [Bacteroidota bacterium]
MKDRLEDFVLKNREQFDVREPDPSLWLKINPENKGGHKKNRIMWFRYAAAVAFIFASFSAGIYFLSGSGSEAEKLYGDLYEEIRETEAYYSTMVNQKYNELQPYITSSPNLKNELDFDLNELDEIYLELKEDLKENAGNPEVIDAMIRQYRMKVEILEQLLDQLKEKKTNNYEEEKKISL